MFRGNVKSRYQKWRMIFVFVLLLAASSAAFAYFGLPWHTWSTGEEVPRAAPDPATRWYVLNKDIASGHRLQTNDVRTVQGPLTADLRSAGNSLDRMLNRYSRLELRSGTILQDTLFSTVPPRTDDVRLCEFQTIRLPSSLNVDDYVDVRIKLQNGLDYIVLAKKRVKQLQAPLILLELTEAEILRMSSALVDVEQAGALMYALRYAEPYMQRAARSDYPVRAEVQELLQKKRSSQQLLGE